MSTDLTLGGEVFEYPDQNEDPGWGENAHDWAVKATEVLNSLSGADDIPITTSIISNDASIATNVSGLSFNTSTVRSFITNYIVIRQDIGFSTIVQDGTLEGVYDGSSWSITDTHNRDAGMTFDITSGGQVQYFSSNLTISGTYAGTIKFKATTISQ